jgi:extradiol dioxygenase family protein
MNTSISPFHLAIPVYNLNECRTFYRDFLGCEEGRSSDHWVDFNFFGHQLVIHYKPKAENSNLHTNPVDGKDVPVPHFGVVLAWDIFNAFAEDLKSKNIEFIIEPYVRFQGLVGEQATMFFYDPAGNALEFKAFKDTSQLFAK